MANATRTIPGNRTRSLRQRVDKPLTVMAILFSLTAALSILCACQRVENVAYSHYVALADGGWDPETHIDFHPWPMDSLGTDHLYDMQVAVRFIPGKAPRKLPLVVIYETENSEDTDTISIPLLDDEGEPLGKKLLTTFEVETTLKENFKLSPGLTVEISPLTDTGADAGLLNVGLRLVDRSLNDNSFSLKNLFNL